jgi:hypothetical protein
MESNSERLTGPILQTLDSRVRQSVLRRVDAMERELGFLTDRNEQSLRVIRERGWTDDRLEVLFVLNSVYQQVLGPLQAAARGGPEGLGSSVPVRHGRDLFDGQYVSRISRVMLDFVAIVEAMEYQRTWLHANTCGDLVFAIASSVWEGRGGEQT